MRKDVSTTPAVPGAMAMTEERLAQLIALDAKATPGPWFVQWDEDQPWDIQISSDEAGDHRVAHMFHNNGRDDERDGATATLIALSRNSLPALLSELTRLRAQVREGDIALEEIEEATPDGYSFNDLRAIARAARRPQPAPTEGGKG